jgi:hypothetical protein
MAGSWKELLVDCQSYGLVVAPHLTIVKGAPTKS